MTRTPEQKQADDNLTEAIIAALQAYKLLNEAEVLMEYAIVVSFQGYTEQGLGDNGINMIFRDGSIPEHRAIGLFEMAKMRLM